MKNLQLTLSIALAAAVCFAPVSAASAVLIDNLQLHATFDAGDVSGTTNGSTVNDTSGAPLHNGTVVGNGITSASGQIQEAFDFPSTASYVNFGNVLNPGTGSYTASTWFNTDSIPSGFSFIGGKGAQSSGANGWALAVQDDTFVTRTKTTTGTQVAIISDAGSIIANTWYHGALVIDRGTGMVSAYLNGSDAAYSGGNSAVIDASSVTTTVNLVVGVRPSNLDLSFVGLIDDFAIWDRALSPTEIQEVYELGLAGLNVQEELPFIPEPSTWLMFTMAAPWLIRRRQRRARRVA